MSARPTQALTGTRFAPYLQSEEAHMDCLHDRAAEDLGNIVALEPVNVTAPDQQSATLSYVVALGLPSD